MDMGCKFKSMEREEEVEPKKGSKIERKKKKTQDGGRIDRKNTRNTRPTIMETASA
jgi:hypothetical protein